MHSTLRPMTVADYDAVIALWRDTEGIGLSDADSRPNVESFLQRNPGLSLVAPLPDERIVGAVLCGHDGRRGYLHHLAVARDWRGRGLGRALVQRCLGALAGLGIAKCNIFLFSDHDPGRQFWLHNGWIERADLRVLQKPTANPSSR